MATTQLALNHSLAPNATFMAVKIYCKMAISNPRTFGRFWILVMCGGTQKLRSVLSAAALSECSKCEIFEICIFQGKL